MELLGDTGHIESRLGVRQVHGLRQTYHRLRYCFGCTQLNFLVMWVMWNLASFRLETLLVLVQDR